MYLYSMKYCKNCEDTKFKFVVKECIGNPFANHFRVEHYLLSVKRSVRRYPVSFLRWHYNNNY